MFYAAYIFVAEAAFISTSTANPLVFRVVLSLFLELT
jgi:hypothetical protein